VENQKKTPCTAQFDVDGYHNAQKRWEHHQ
jgi:hypothetical protein